MDKLDVKELEAVANNPQLLKILEAIICKAKGGNNTYQGTYFQKIHGFGRLY